MKHLKHWWKHWHQSEKRRVMHWGICACQNPKKSLEQLTRQIGANVTIGGWALRAQPKNCVQMSLCKQKGLQDFFTILHCCTKALPKQVSLVHQQFLQSTNMSQKITNVFLPHNSKKCLKSDCEFKGHRGSNEGKLGMSIKGGCEKWGTHYCIQMCHCIHCLGVCRDSGLADEA